MFTEYTREEIAKHDRSPLANKNKSSADESILTSNESLEIKEDETVVNDLNSPVTYDMEGESLW